VIGETEKMKKAFLILLCAAAYVLPTMSFYGESGENTALQLPLKDKGIVKCEIVVPDEAGPVAKFAGKELKELLSQSLGADIQVLKEPSGGKTALILGNNKLLSKAGIDISKLPVDAFIIKSVGRSIFIAGIDDMAKEPEVEMKNMFVWGQLYDRATLFGVYDFLERYLGMRFYFPEKMGTVVPKYESLKIDPMDIFEKPDYTVRNFGYSGVLPDGRNGKDAYWYKNLNKHRLRMQAHYLPNEHGLARMEYINRFAQGNPEYFALMPDGRRHCIPTIQHTPQFCFSSNLKEEIFKDAEAYLSGKPANSRNLQKGWSRVACQPGYYNIMPTDGFYKCTCAECQKHFSKGPQATSDFVWDVICDTAEKLKKNNVPGIVTAMAYYPYHLVPARKIPDNVMVMVSRRGPWNLQHPGIYEKENREIKEWHDKLGKKVWLWNYVNKTGNLAMPNIPSLTPKTIGEYYKKESPYIFGAYMCSATDRYLYHYLNYYVFGKVAWDNKTDVDKVLKEHYQKMFGAAADKMENIYGRFEGNWLKISGKPIVTELGPASIPVSDFEMWETIYSAEEVNAIDKLFDEAEEATAKSTEDNERVKFIRTGMFNPLKEQRGLYLQNKESIEDMAFHVKELVAKQEIKLDASVDASEWQDSDKVFLSKLDKNKIPPVKTTVRAMRDKENLYFSFECEEPEMENIVAGKHEQDDKNILRESSVEIFLNPSGDRRKYYQIILTPSGSLMDIAAEKIGAEQTYDMKWASNCTYSVKKYKDHWVAEIAVPIKSLPGFKSDGFPANFGRSRVISSTLPSFFSWSPVKDSFHEIHNYGVIKFNNADEDNLVKNGDFLEPVKDLAFGAWHILQNKTEGDASWEIVSDESVTDCNSLRISSSEGGKLVIEQQLPKLKSDTEYLLTFFVKTENIVPLKAKQSGAYANIWEHETRHVFPVNYYIGTIPWTKQGFRFKTGSGEEKSKRACYVRLGINEAKGTVWFDDIKLREVKNK
jgi:hypothetical protein